MSRVNRRRAKVDSNQAGIVKALRALPGVSVELGMDDFLVGYKGQTFWVELKEEGKESKTTPYQKELLERWTGHYIVTSSLDEILETIGIN